jgi:hypothetical protein
MKSRIALMFVALSLVVAPALFAQGNGNGQGNDQQGNDKAPQDAGVHWAKGQFGRGGSGALMFNHGGSIMAKVDSVQAIFWGQSWTNYSGDKISGIDTFYSGLVGSTYAHTCDEYTGPAGTSVGDYITYGGSLIDTSFATGGSNTGPILAEVCKMIATPSSSGYYPVYTDIPRGNAGYCAWHSSGSCNGTTVQFAFFFKLDGDPGCDPQDTSGLHSQGLAALANVSGHELSEARTDPQLNAWFDQRGNENGDKCAWTFGSPLLTFSNQTQWKIQGNWSNAAYLSPTRGYRNLSGQKGCIDGTNYQ